MLLATALIPVYFKTLAEPGSSVVVAWGYAETVASLLLALSILLTYFFRLDFGGSLSVGFPSMPPP